MIEIKQKTEKESKATWRKVTAEELCIKVTDGTHDTPRRLDHGHSLITSKQLTGGRVSSTDYFISEKDFKEVNRRSKVDQWDVLFGMIGTIGETVIVKYENPQFAIKNVGLFKTGGDEITSKWLYYYMKSPVGRAYIKSVTRGTSQGFVPLGALREFPIYIPEDKRLREKLVSILAAFDDKIELNNKISRTLEQMAQAIFKEWFISPTKKSELPNEWRTTSLKEVADITMGQSPASEHYNERGEGLPFHQGVTNFGKRFPTHKIYCTENNRIAEKGDILLSVRAPVGRTNISNTTVSLGRGVAGIREKRNRQSFVYYFLRHRFQREDSLGSGSVFLAVTRKDLEELPILIPGERTMEKFRKSVHPLDKNIESISNENQKLAALRDLLLPKLMSGEISV